MLHGRLARHGRDCPFPETIPFARRRDSGYTLSVFDAARILALPNPGLYTEPGDAIQESIVWVDDVLEYEMGGSPQSGAIACIGTCP